MYRVNVQILVFLRVDLLFHTLVHLISIHIEEIIELIITEERILTLMFRRKGIDINTERIFNLSKSNRTPLTILLIQKI